MSESSDDSKSTDDYVAAYRFDATFEPFDSPREIEILSVVGTSSPMLASGEVVTADEAYIRESILQPQATIVNGYQPIMPTFQGQIDEEGLLALIQYIKSLVPEEAADQG